MWEKSHHRYLDHVVFWSDQDGDFRELRFAFNECIDGRYASAEDRQFGRNPKSSTDYPLKGDYGAFITESNDFDDSKPLEALIHHGDHNLTIPAEYLTRVSPFRSGMEG
jgi:hypothetical protein